jgi:hypothetical protein
MEKVNRLSLLGREDAATKYRIFLEKFPHLANRGPLHYLASYLGITPQSLSRVRKKLGRPPKSTC